MAEKLIKMSASNTNNANSPTERNYWKNEIEPLTIEIKNLISQEKLSEAKDRVLYTNRKIDYAPTSENKPEIKTLIEKLYTEFL